MAKKKKNEKPKRELTKKQLSHWEKEKKRQRLIFWTGVSVIAVVVLGILGGWIYYQFLPMHQTVLKVNDRAFNMSYYIDMLELYGGNNPSGMTDTVAQAIEQSEMMYLEAARLGVTVSNDEVKKEMEGQDPPLDKKYFDVARTQLLSDKMQNEYFDKQVPASAEQRQGMAMFLESYTQAQDVTKRLENGEDFSTLAGELSLDSYSKGRKGDLGWRPKGILSLIYQNTEIEDYIFSAEAGKLSLPIQDKSQTKQVGYWLLRVLERKESPPEAHIQGILLGSEEEAKEVKARLDAGESFDALAKEFSKDTNSRDAGGEMGWIPKEYESKALADYAFNTDIELKTLSDPLRDDTASTVGGYWLLKVAAIEADRPLDDENKTALIRSMMSDWVSGLLDNPDYVVEDLLDAEKKAFAVQQVQKRAK